MPPQKKAQTSKRKAERARRRAAAAAAAAAGGADEQTGMGEMLEMDEEALWKKTLRQACDVKDCRWFTIEE